MVVKRGESSQNSRTVLVIQEKFSVFWQTKSFGVEYQCLSFRNFYSKTINSVGLCLYDCRIFKKIFVATKNDTETSWFEHGFFTFVFGKELIGIGLLKNECVNRSMVRFFQRER